MENEKRTWLRLAKEAVQNRYHARRLIGAIDPARPEERDDDLKHAAVIVGLAFYSGWKFACDCCKPKMWAHFESISRETCACGCGETLEATIAEVKQLLERPLENPPDELDCILIARFALQFRHDVDEPRFASTLRKGLKYFDDGVAPPSVQ
jgi:hypothetical protein